MAPTPLTKAHFDQLTRSMATGFRKLNTQIKQTGAWLEKLVEKRIDDLAASVSRGFADVDVQLDQLKAGQEALEG